MECSVTNLPQEFTSLLRAQAVPENTLLAKDLGENKNIVKCIWNLTKYNGF